MDELYDSPPLQIQTLTPQSGTESQISMLNSNPGFYPAVDPPTPTVKN